ncbi:MAG: hypothetical protein HY291_00645 [Planctomycetes bacterium]|nr:hypothetical protein [Planctomycetota bacterium]
MTAEGGTDGGEPRFLPASDLARCPIAAVARACRGTPPLAGASESWRKALEVIELMEREGEKAIAAQTLADLVPPPPTPQVAPAAVPATDPKPATGPAGN